MNNCLEKMLDEIKELYFCSTSCTEAIRQIKAKYQIEYIKG